MDKKVEKWGDSIEIAVQLALKELKLTREEVEVEVLEQPTKGFLGFHKKLAKVRVSKKPEPEPELEPAAEAEEIVEEPAHGTVRETVGEAEEKKQRVRPEKTEKAEKRGKTAKEEKKGSFFGENTYVVSDPRNNAKAEEEEAEVLSEPEEVVEIPKPVKRRRNSERRRGGNAAVSMNTKFTVTEEDEDAVPADDSYAVEFVRKIIDQMGLSEVEVKGSFLNDVLYISLTGKEVGALIGKRGKTLDSLQYLASIVENKNTEKYTRVLVNAESYREKRERTLQQLAVKVADKCARSGRSQRLEPMNPYERKVIHSTLQSDPRVATRSEGSEPSRRVVIEVKK